MPRTIDYYFSLVSPWAYIGHAPFMEIAQRHGVEVNHKPVFLGRVFSETGGLPLSQRHPARQRYRIVELQRWREKRGLAFNLQPKHWPFHVTLRDRQHHRGGVRAQPRERRQRRRLRLTGLCARGRGVLGPGPARPPRRRAED